MITAYVVSILFIVSILAIGFSFYNDSMTFWKRDKKWKFYIPNYKSPSYKVLNALHQKGLRDER